MERVESALSTKLASCGRDVNCAARVFTCKDYAHDDVKRWHGAGTQPCQLQNRYRHQHHSVESRLLSTGRRKSPRTSRAAAADTSATTQSSGSACLKDRHWGSDKSTCVPLHTPACTPRSRDGLLAGDHCCVTSRPVLCKNTSARAMTWGCRQKCRQDDWLQHRHGPAEMAKCVRTYRIVPRELRGEPPRRVMWRFGGGIHHRCSQMLTSPRPSHCVTSRRMYAPVMTETSMAWRCRHANARHTQAARLSAPTGRARFLCRACRPSQRTRTAHGVSVMACAARSGGEDFYAVLGVERTVDCTFCWNATHYVPNSRGSPDRHIHSPCLRCTSQGVEGGVQEAGAEVPPGRELCCASNEVGAVSS